MKKIKKLSSLFVTIAGVSLALLATSCGSTTTEDEVPSTGTDEPETPVTPADPVVTKYIMEAEEAYSITTTISGLACGNEGLSSSDINYASGDAYVSSLNSSGDAVLTYKVTAAADVETVLSLCLGKRQTAYALSDMFTVTINGTDVVLYEDVTWDVNEGPRYYDWEEKEIATVNLTEGENEIVFTKVTTGLNFDYFAFYSTVEITSANDHPHYTYSSIVERPTETAEGLARGVCDQCYKSITGDVTLPVLSTENYEYTETLAPTATEFGTAEWSYTPEGTDVAIIYRTYLNPTDGVNTLKYEAEDGEFTGNASVTLNDSNNAAYPASGTGYVGGLSANTGSIKLTFTASTAAQALFTINISARENADYDFNTVTITVNDVEVDFGSIVIRYVNSSTRWYNWREYDICLIDLVEGENTVEFANAGGNLNNVDYFVLTSVAELTVPSNNDGEIDQGEGGGQDGGQNDQNDGQNENLD